MRKIPKSLAIVGLLTPLVAPVNAGALGIGDIRVRSNLNQSLLAEIPLVTSGSDSISDVKINLAPPEAFSRAGIERQFFLSKLIFKPVQKPDGTYVIQVTSREPITEPFLNFLVEVNWPQGHLLREFTALLDPPATYDDRTSPQVQAPVALKSADETPITTDAGIQRSEIRPIKPRKPSPAAPSLTASSENGSYGPVMKDETLWAIARNLGRSAKIAPEQLMRALFEANPSAFSHGNINLLKAGATLVVPGIPGELSAEAVAAKPKPETTRTTDSKPQQTLADKEASSENQSGQLKLFSPTDSTAQKAPLGDDSGVEQKSEPAANKSETLPQGDEIKAKLAELEQKLSAMQGLITLKDQQIATLQSSQKPAVAKNEQSKDLAPTSESTKASPPSPSPTAQSTTSTTPPPAPQQAQTPAAVKTPTSATPSPKETPAAPSSEWIPDGYYLVVGGVGTFLLGALIWVTYRRRAAMLDDFESMFPRDAQESAFSEVYANHRPPEAKAAPAEAGSSSKSSFLVEFSASDFDALDTESDELDPISEADVYLAYGRYKQAEDLIRHAISQHPDRDECKLKLLEIHYATENREAFETFARELYTAKKDSDPEFWGKVTEMGRELCPTSALFETGEATSLTLGDEDLKIIQPITQKIVKESDDTEDGQPFPYEKHVPDFLSTSTESDLVHKDLEFDGDVGLELTSTAENASHTQVDDEPLRDSMSLDFDFGLINDTEEPSTEISRNSSPSVPVDIVDLTDMNEIETKLDLAKAFVDMEDVDSAREILEEIAKDGTDAQKEEARSLLAKIE